MLGLASLSILPGVGAVASAAGSVACFHDGLNAHGAGFAFSTVTNLAGTASIVCGAVNQDVMGMAVGVGMLAGTAVQNFALMGSLAQRL